MPSRSWRSSLSKLRAKARVECWTPAARLKLIPSVTGTFSSSLPLLIFLQAYERDTEAVRPLVAFLTFYRGDVKVFESEAFCVDTWDPKPRAAPIRLSVAAGQLEPGSYECQVTVLDPSGGKTTFWRAGVVVAR